MLIQSSFAHANLPLEESFRDYLYDVQVVWDQKDLITKKEMEDRFISRTLDLGYSFDEVAKYLIENKLDDQAKQEVSFYYSKELSDEQKIAFLEDIATRSQHQGASWSSSIGVALVRGLIIGVIIGLIIREQDNCKDGTWSICE